jgi:hypothetical protein
MQGELSRFARELRIHHEQLKGEAILAPLEPNLELSVAGDGKGHVEVKGTARIISILGHNRRFASITFQQ